MLPSRSKHRTQLCIYAIFLVTLSLGTLSVGPIVDAITRTLNFHSSRHLKANHIISESPLHVSSSRKVPNGTQMTRYGSVGEQRTFWIQNFTDFTHYQVSANLLATGIFSAVFITTTCINIEGESSAISFAESICDEFDSTIYPQITDLAGHPNGTLGDIDGDSRIVILVSTNWVSYYSQYNELPMSPSNPYSNECEMIYIYYWTWLFPTIAHEFHHLIWFNTEMDEQQFTLEGLATYAEYHAGYLGPYENLEPRVPDFLTHPEDSLLYWNGFGEAGLPSDIDYGGAYLFTFYIAEKYGVDILRDFISEPTDGPEGIEATLQAAGYAVSFNDLYLDWMTAVTLDELGFSNNLYGYEALNARIHYNTLPTTLPPQQPLTLRYYGIHAYEITNPNDTFSIEVHKASNTTIGLSIAFHDTFGWQVHQHVLLDGQTSFTDSIEGLRINEAYIMASFLANSTPPGHREYGLGPTTTIQLSFTPTNPTTPYPDPTLLVGGIIVIIITFTVSVVIIIKRQNRVVQ